MNYNYKERTDRAYELHQAGELDEAEKIYKQLLSEIPDDVNVLNLYGLLLISKNSYQDAITYLSKAMLYKKDAYVISNLAKAYYMAEEYENSALLYQKSLEYEVNDDTFYSLALSFKKLNKIKDAIKAYKAAVKVNPKNLSAYYNLILLLTDCGKFDKAVECGLEACKNNENADEIYTLLSGLYENKKDINNAILYLEKAIDASPKEYIYYYNLGVLYSKINKFEEAAENYRKSLLLNPQNIESYVNIASVYKKMKKPEIAIQYLEIAYEEQDSEPVLVLSLAQTYKDLGQNDKSIEILNKFIKLNNKILNNCAKRFVKLISENNKEKTDKLYINAEKINKNGAEACSLLAMNYMDKCEYKTALKYYEKAIESDNENLSYKHGKAVALKYLGDTEQCRKILEEIVNTGKADSQTKITLGMMYLQQKQLKKGMELYTERNNSTAFVDLFKNKIYNYGQDITNKKVLLYSNCGLGDTIMYSRFFNEIKSKCKSLILQTDSQLVKIMRDNFPDITVIKKSEQCPDFDIALPVMDLQYFLNINFDDIKPPKKYLEQDEKLAEFFKTEIFSSYKKMKIGLCWQGNKKIFKNRSVPYYIIEDFIKDNEYEYFSFQVNEDSEEKPGINSLKKYIFNYNDTAALLSDMDLIITIDSSLAHMAGALGIKTFLVLPLTAEWRWFDDKNKTRWYKSVKIFRQTKSNVWDDVFVRIKKELKKNKKPYTKEYS